MINEQKNKCRSIQRISLDLDKDLPLYTIASTTEIEAKYIRQASGTNCFAKVDLVVKPYHDRRIALFNDRISEINLGNTVLSVRENNESYGIEALNTISQGIIAGILKVCLDTSRKSYLIGGIETIATSAMYHPVDSRSQCYEMAVYLTLLKVFEETNLVKI